MVDPDRLQVKIWSICRFTCRITKARTQTHTQNTQYLLHFHDNSDYVNAPRCYVICTLQVLLGFYNSTVEIFFYEELCTISWWLLPEMQGSKCPKKET